MQTFQAHAALAPHPASQLAKLIETARDPLSRARIALSAAEADLNGLVARYSVSHSAAEATAICAAQTKVLRFRQALDRARHSAIVAVGDAVRAGAL